MDGAQHFILIKARADGLPDLGEQLVLLRAAVGIVRDQVVLEGESELQRQPYHQTRTGSSERPALGMRKQNHSEGMLAGLQADGGEIADLSLRKHFLEIRKAAGRYDRQRLRHVGEVMRGEQAALTVGQFADVFACASLGQNLEKFRGKSALHRGQQAAPALGDIDDGAAARKGAGQPVQRRLHAGQQIVSREQAPRVHSQRGESESIFLHGVALVFKQHHHHRDAQQHLRDRAENVTDAAKHFHPGIAGLNGAHQHRPQRQGKRQQLEGDRTSAVSVQVENRRTIKEHRAQEKHGQA